MLPLSQKISLACCSLGLLFLTQCGGSSSSGGNAPDTLNGTVLSIRLRITASDFPNIFELITATNGQSSLQTRGQNIEEWNGSPTVIYHKTGNNAATLNLRWIAGKNNTTAYSMDLPALEFDQSTHASVGGEGGTLSRQPAGQEMQTLNGVSADVTITYSN